MLVILRADLKSVRDDESRLLLRHRHDVFAADAQLKKKKDVATYDK